MGNLGGSVDRVWKSVRESGRSMRGKRGESEWRRGKGGGWSEKLVD